MQATTDISWIPALDMRIHLGVDGISLPLLVLTALLTFLCALYTYFKMPAGPFPQGLRRTAARPGVRHPRHLRRPRPAAVLPRLRDGAHPDVLPHRPLGRCATGSAAAWKFILYTLLGSVVMLLGLLLIGIKSGTFDMVALATDNGPGLSTSVQVIAVFGDRDRTRRQDADVAAAQLAAGRPHRRPDRRLGPARGRPAEDGHVRVRRASCCRSRPTGCHTFAPYLAAFAVVGIIYGSLACLALARQGAKGDLKRLIAYSSVGHMGFVLLGIATMTPTGVNGALFANIAHGLITGLLFFLVGALKDRTGTTDLDTLAGPPAPPSTAGPRASAACSPSPPSPPSGCPASPGSGARCWPCSARSTPPTASAAPRSSPSWRSPRFGTLLTAAYMLIVVRRVCMGDRRTADRTPPASPRRRADGYEFAAWTPLVALTVVAGLWPAALLGLTDPAVQQLLAGGPR